MNDDHNTGEDDIHTLIAQLRFPSAVSRLHAAEELGRLGDARAVQPLLQALCGVRDVAMRTAGIQALGKIGAPAIAQLSSILASRQYCAIELRAEAAAVLGMIGGKEALRPLSNALLHGPLPLVIRAARALGILGLPEANEPLLGLLRHSDLALRRAAADALANVGDESAIALLSETLLDSDEATCFAAAKALGQIAQRCPSLTLRAAIPQLKRLQRRASTPEMRAVTGQSLSHITNVTDAVHDLPQPASAPPVSADILPVPASAPPLPPGTLPLPAAAPEGATDGASQRLTFLEKVRNVLRRDRHERSS